MNIMVVEPNAQQRLLLEKVMKLHGERTFSTEDHGAALNARRNDFMDMAIIDLDGKPAESIELVRHIRLLETEAGKRTYIIIGSEKGDTSDVLDVLEAGANEFMSKPYEREALEAKVLLGKRLEHASDAIGVLTEEHRAILRVTGILRYIAERITEKEIPRKLLDWATSTSFLLDSELHHRKEEHFIVSFLEAALKNKGEQSDTTIFSRSALKSIETEHRDLIGLKKEIQVNIARYSQGVTEERMDDLRNSIEDYVHLLEEHMHREERFLFPASRPLISKEENVRLLGEFRDVEAGIGIEKIDERTRLLLAAEKLVENNLKKRKAPNLGG